MFRFTVVRSLERLACLHDLAYGGESFHADHPACAFHAMRSVADRGEIALLHRFVERGSVFVIGALKVRQNVALGRCKTRSNRSERGRIEDVGIFIADAGPDLVRLLVFHGLLLG